MIITIVRNLQARDRGYVCDYLCLRKFQVYAFVIIQLSPMILAHAPLFGQLPFPTTRAERS